LTVYIFYSRTSRRGQTCDTRTQEPKTPNLIRGLFRLDIGNLFKYGASHLGDWPLSQGQLRGEGDGLLPFLFYS
jgi:hypothetical protein